MPIRSKSFVQCLFLTLIILGTLSYHKNSLAGERSKHSESQAQSLTCEKALKTNAPRTTSVTSPSSNSPQGHFHFTQVLNNDDHYREHVLVGDIDSMLFDREILIKGVHSQTSPLAEETLRKEKMLFQDPSDSHPFIYQNCFQNPSNEGFDPVQCEELIKMACAKIFRGSQVNHCKKFPEIIRGHIISEDRKPRSYWENEVRTCQDQAKTFFKGHDLPGLMPECQDLLQEACEDSFHYLEFKDQCQAKIDHLERDPTLATQILPPDNGAGFITEKALEALIDSSFEKQSKNLTQNLMFESSEILIIKNPILLPKEESHRSVKTEAEHFSDFYPRFMTSVTKLIQAKPDGTDRMDNLIGNLLGYMYPFDLNNREKIRKCLIAGTCTKEILCESYHLETLQCTDEKLGRHLAQIHAKFVESLGVPNVHVPLRLFKQTSFWPETSYRFFQQIIAPSLFNKHDWLDEFPEEKNLTWKTSQLSPLHRSNEVPGLSMPEKPQIEVTLKNPHSHFYWEYEVTYWENQNKIQVLLGICMVEPCARAGGGFAKRGEILSLSPKCGPGFYSTPRYPDVIRSDAPYKPSPCRE